MEEHAMSERDECESGGGGGKVIICIYLLCFLL